MRAIKQFADLCMLAAFTALMVGGLALLPALPFIAVIAVIYWLFW